MSMRRGWTRVGWALVLCWAWGEAVGAAAEGRAAITAGQYRGANVIFIEFADVRRDHLGCYGYARPTTPHLDALAKRGIRFEHVVTAAPWCVPGKNAIWTGLYPSAHGVVNKYEIDEAGGVRRARLADTIPTFPELLKRQAGYTLVAFTGGAGVSGVSGLDRGFDLYNEGPDLSGFDVTVPRAVDWLRTEFKEPFFMFLQGYTAHGQAAPPAGGYQRVFAADYQGPLTGSAEEFKRFREESLKQRYNKEGPGLKRLPFNPEDEAFYVALYDERIQEADRWVGRFLEALNALKLNERTIVVFFAGHGDEYFDHGFIDHGTNLYEEVIDVPLIITLPGMTEGRVVASQVRTIDLFPTTFELLGLSHHPVTGVSILPAMNGKPLSLVGFSETEYRLFTHKSALIAPDHRYKLLFTHETGERELYDLAKDPHEQHNLAQRKRRLTDQLEQQLFAIRLGMKHGRRPESMPPPMAPRRDQPERPAQTGRIGS